MWLETDLAWFGERPRALFAMPALAPSLAGEAPFEPFGPVVTGLDASRRRRETARSTRRRRLATRTVPAVALVVGSTTMLSVAALRNGTAAQEPGFLLEDPPSLTFGLDVLAARPGSVPRRLTSRAEEVAVPQPTYADIEWNRATSVGLPFSGHLHDGTQLPVLGPDWVTWNPVTDSVPNAPGRLFGHERTIRTVVAVAAAYRAAHPKAPPLLVGDISWRDGGTMEQHVSHQNGLDVDIYYPRHDRRPAAPLSTGQIDRRLAQDLLDRFVAAGAKMVFVGFSTDLTGPHGVVVPYPNHENHMHVRFPSPG